MKKEKSYTCPASVHQSICEMYDLTKEKGIVTVFDRWLDQQPQCNFGVQGVCCQLCSHGPCRISAKVPYGICGANADTIVARNLVRLACHGAAAYSHHLEELAETIIATANGKTPFKIQSPEKLKSIAQTVGLDTSQSIENIAIQLSNLILSELRKGADEPLALVEILAPETRKKAWRNLNIFPGGVHSEIRDALTKSMTSINTDPIDLLLTALRLSIAAGYMGLVATITLQDILLGTPTITETEADLGVIDPATVNILAHGHVPFVATAVLMASQKPEMINLAKEAGATGIKIYGSMDTGQELMQRLNSSAKGFAGQVGNWINQEYVIATGAIDLVMMDLNCSIPGLKTTADNFHTELVCVDKIIRMAGVEKNIDYSPEKIEKQAEELIKIAIEAYKKRGKEIHIPKNKSNVVAGFSVESILGALGGTLNPLLEAIKSGKVKGVAAVVGCTNNKNGHDTTTVALVKELIKRDILVINCGCVSSAVQMEGLMQVEAAKLASEGLRSVCEALSIPPCLNFGSCVDIGRIGVLVTAIASALNLDPSELPIVASAPEYLEQKAVVDGLFAVAFGLLVHLSPAPPVTGSELVTKTLTHSIEGLIGGKVLVETDPANAADLIEHHIELKRKNLTKEKVLI